MRGSLDRSKGDPDWDLRKTGNTRLRRIRLQRGAAAVPSAAGSGDRRLLASLLQRMLEVVEAIKIIRQGLVKYKKASGSHRVELPKHLSPGDAYVETECPRGQMGLRRRQQRQGTGAARAARSSSMANLSLTSKICQGCLIADIPRSWVRLIL